MLFKKTNILLILSVLLGLISCTTTKVPEGKRIISKTVFKGEKVFSNSQLRNYVKQKELNFLPIGVWSYNLYDQKYEEAFRDYYLLPVSKRKVFRLDSLSDQYNIPKASRAKFYSLGRFFYRNKKEPSILDSTLSGISVENLQKFYKSKGFFTPEVSVSHKPVGKKKVKEIYTIQSGPASVLNSYSFQIADPNLDSLYSANLYRSKIRVAQRFDLDKFEKERDFIADLFQENGYYGFDADKNQIGFLVDSTSGKNKLDVILKITKNPLDSLGEIKPYYFKEIIIYGHKAGFRNKKPEDPSLNEGYILYNYKKDKPKEVQNKIEENLEKQEETDNIGNQFTNRAYTDLVLIRPGDKYDLKNVVKTKNNIYSNKNYTLSKFEITPYTSEDSLSTDQNLLRATIELVPKKQHSFEAFLEGSYSAFMNFGIAPGLRYSLKNALGGGEILDLSTSATIGTVKLADSQSENNFFNAYQLGLNAQMTFPRMLGFESIPKDFTPKTMASFNLNMQQNIGLSNINATGQYRYEIQPSDKSTHSFRVLNLELNNNRDQEKYYSIFTTDNTIKNTHYNEYFAYNPSAGEAYERGELTDDDIAALAKYDILYPLTLQDNQNYLTYLKMLERKSIITQNNLIASTSYHYLYNQEKDLLYLHPFSVSALVEFSGSTLSLLDNLIDYEKEYDPLEQKDHNLLFGIRYAQFIRAEVDLRKKWNFGYNNAFALRGFAGIAVPFGNSEQLPFSRSYFAGGANDIRAWRAYSLGPGATKSDYSDFSIGNVKLTLNMELRNFLTDDLYSAVFIDAGNIWELNGLVDESSLTSKDFYKNIGVGVGAGLRYDLTFLLLRFDFAYKAYNPIFDPGQRWVIKDIRPIQDVMVNFGINYPF
ncbi:MAG: hypothetical protein C4K58_01865 [Flavobacteriaceae bacterium]|nr:MAG: hypothetical protein C4K58_01865 [Flavobacteriaceae bacterium]